MEKYRNKYRIESARLKNWDYGWNALYFVTICTKNREHFFGDVIKAQNIASPYEMQLSEIGKMAEKYWYEIPEHFPFVKLDAFIVMPNHIHGIIEIAKSDDERDERIGVQTQNFASVSSPPPTQSSSQNKFGPQSKNLASIIRGYKIGVTKYAKTIANNWGWQPRYYDHIIRNNKSFENIRNYIVNNPQKWSEDNFYNRNTK